ncbi:nitrate/sulfonate/bicarbonate ABC transporter ATP-binding protein [Rhodococcus sp. RS1C4]|uniref:ABC transporter ATP-binding protein n=1 Tax=Nocardiaceae TaxID=85025 RepID=UPI00037CC237|nr:MULTISPECIES: ABC transporter ATP-binding protein [Rhodococcus]OZC56646.1 nitrate/sulfonate/bicarbonate ABC transporter ATP-binding protein [Rhodococcus sp. RS1C4]OZC58648.1 nitrate/sulfonate/bicarbonate ABC transporter ATP-binding protein [Rhodococcus sp. 06-621-2]OZD11326.1 nitrate/sulfonate/bicarbonate ABC transporter ATP-binding protein [Rhodococcus sp. 06-156-3C]OZD13560.1 nitrate/sulfonate/bicarbonate ABC transporter ATP-binding protein [Rhodococcus sp. 06-156-4a]OZD22100.1 nitrate/su
MNKAVEVNNVGVSFRSRDGDTNAVLDGVNFDVEHGQFVSIVGQSGSGKTTLLKTISGLQAATKGEVLIKGDPIAAGVEEIGMVFQSPVLLPWRNNLDNVLLPLEFRGTRDNASKARALELLDMVGLKDKAKRYSYELSGGMQQRVAICRALVSDPELLLMDEPFGALDAMTRDTMNFEIQRIWQKTGCSVVFVTHSISEAVWLGDRVVVVGDRPGRIIADITIDLPRPRDKEHRYSPTFADYVTEVESHIGVTAGIS